MEKYEYNGETYYFNDGRWMTSKFVSAPAGILCSIINGIYSGHFGLSLGKS